MAESKKPAAPKAEPAAPVLLGAGESSDPAVHALLAKRQTAVLNGDEATAADVDGRLADLGYR